MLHNMGNQAFDKRFAQVHVVFEISERHLRLDHPELRRVPRCVRIFCAECGAEGVYLAQRTGKQLGLQLSRNGEIGFLSEKVVGKSCCVVLVDPRQGRDDKHLPRPFAVYTGNDGGLNIIKASIAKKLVYGKGTFRADAEQGTVFVCPWAQMTYLAQEFI